MTTTLEAASRTLLASMSGAPNFERNHVPLRASQSHVVANEGFEPWKPTTNCLTGVPANFALVVRYRNSGGGGMGSPPALNIWSTCAHKLNGLYWSPTGSRNIIGPARVSSSCFTGAVLML